MRIRNAVAAAVSTVGATAAANRALASRAEPFEPFLDGAQGTYRWRGFDISYTERGAPENQDLLLLHGISAAASSHQFWRVIEDLSAEYHVIAPDLPGFGHSDRPPLLYSAPLYTTFIEDVVADLVTGPVVVASSLTGAYTADAVNDEVDRVILVTPTADTAPERRWLRTLVRSPVVGQGLFNLLASKPSIRRFSVEMSYTDTTRYPDAALEYEWLTAHQPGARFAPASFLSGDLDPATPLSESLASVDAPVTLVWGRDAEPTPLSTARGLARDADAGLVVFDDACLLPHAEHPDAFVDLVTGDLATDATVQE
jgi:Predicted hydrolases or acyltransferases (alpha/beta hydrolase superfamily)